MTGYETASIVAVFHYQIAESICETLKRCVNCFIKIRKMLLTALMPTESLEKAYRLQSGNLEQIDRFKANFTKLLGLINERESEENVKGI